MTGVPLLITFVIAIVVMILAISKLKLHPFLAIMGVALLLAIVVGIPLADIPGTIGAGFSGTFSSIGIVIILGAMIGFFLEKTGGAIRLADAVVKIVGKKHPEIAIMLMGWIVSIPVFCDSGFVILNPIRKAMVKKTMCSSVAMTVALSGGLYISHVFIPPTPGPIAAAGTLGIGNNLLLVIGMGALVSIPAWSWRISSPNTSASGSNPPPRTTPTTMRSSRAMRSSSGSTASCRALWPPSPRSFCRSS